MWSRTKAPLVTINYWFLYFQRSIQWIVVHLNISLNNSHTWLIDCSDITAEQVCSLNRYGVTGGDKEIKVNQGRRVQHKGLKNKKMNIRCSFCILLPVSAALRGHGEGPGRDSETTSGARALWGIYEESLHEGRVCSQHGGSRHVPDRATSSSWSAWSVTECNHTNLFLEYINLFKQVAHYWKTCIVILVTSPITIINHKSLALPEVSSIFPC